eukprot:1030966-Lingulodinium_polyedra.AAC.1
MLFVAQFDLPPAAAHRAGEQALRVLFPGPRFWACPSLLKSLKLVGFGINVPDFASIAVASRAR